MTEEQNERRLLREAETVKLGELGDPTTATDTARVEVSYQETWDSTEHAGYYIVHVRVPRTPDYRPVTADDHPANLASDAVYARAKERDYDYFNVDEVYPA